MKKQLLKFLSVYLSIIIFFSSSINAQPNDTTLIYLITLRDSFINQVRDFGFNPSLPAPKIVMDNPVSFGNYDDTTNILHTTSSWQTLPKELKVFFNQAVGGADSSDAGKDLFNKATHQWIFVHELGHWWRACQKQKVSHYDEEIGANRIAVAYWREADSSFMNWQLKVFENLLVIFQILCLREFQKKNILMTITAQLEVRQLIHGIKLK